MYFYALYILLVFLKYFPASGHNDFSTVTFYWRQGFLPFTHGILVNLTSADSSN